LEGDAVGDAASNLGDRVEEAGREAYESLRKGVSGLLDTVTGGLQTAQEAVDPTKEGEGAWREYCKLVLNVAALCDHNCNLVNSLFEYFLFMLLLKTWKVFWNVRTQLKAPGITAKMENWSDDIKSTVYQENTKPDNTDNLVASLQLSIFYSAITTMALSLNTNMNGSFFTPLITTITTMLNQDHTAASHKT